jgi:lactoylglutathione lyase
MLHLGSTYLFVKDMEKSIEFYKKLLDMEPTARAYDRWAQFNFEGKCIALYNNSFDRKNIDANENLDKHYNKDYIKYFEKRKITYGNNCVLNFWIENLNKEYERIKNLNIGVISEILYVNISSPYYFFTVIDPNGNFIEITGAYKKD